MEICETRYFVYKKPSIAAQRLQITSQLFYQHLKPSIFNLQHQPPRHSTPSIAHITQDIMATPFATFVGPAEDGIVYLQDANGHRTPRFLVQNQKHTKPQLQIFRIMPDGTQVPFATGTWSSMSGNARVTLEGREVKMEYNPVVYGFKIQFPQGELEWTIRGNGDKVELVDKNKQSIAFYKFYTASGKELKLDIFVPGDNWFVELIVASAMNIKIQNDKDMGYMKKGLKILSAFA